MQKDKYVEKWNSKSEIGYGKNGKNKIEIANKKPIWYMVGKASEVYTFKVCEQNHFGWNALATQIVSINAK